MALSNSIRDLQFQSGDPATILSTGRQQAGAVADNVPAQNFNIRLMDMLKKYQSLGTRPFAEQSFNAQEAQAQRVFQGPGNLAGASPTLQSQVRGADVSALQPTISSAQQSQQTFGEQIGGFGDAITRAQGLVEGFEKQRQSEKTEAQNIINFALTSGGSSGLEALLKAQPGIVKLSGFDEATIQGLIPTFKKKEEEAAASKKTYSTIDLGNRVAILDSQGNVVRYEAKGITPGTKGTGTGETSTYSTDTASRVIAAVDDLFPRVSNKTVGAGSLASFLPGSDAADFAADLDYLVSNVAFNALQAMRDASKTGGALGQVSERELALLGATLGALKTKQSPENFKKNLNIIKESIRRWQIAAEQAKTTTGGLETGAGTNSSDPLGIR